ncbi:hypothetical protein [Thermaurantiacus sp.]
MTGLWRSWFRLSCGGVIAFGLRLSAGAFEATSGPARLVFALIGRPLPAILDPFHHFLLAVLGAVTMGWGLTLLVVMDHASGPVSATGLAAAILLWFVVDSGLSVATGFPRNVLPNTLILAGVLLPLLAARRLRS